MKRREYILSLVMLASLFFIFGLVSWVNSILVPYFKVACDLKTGFQSYLVTFAFYIAYLVMTIPAALLLNRSNGEDRFSPDEFTLDDLPAEYGQQEEQERQGRNDPLRFLYPDATEEQRSEIRRKYGLEGE